MKYAKESGPETEAWEMALEMWPYSWECKVVRDENGTGKEDYLGRKWAKEKDWGKLNYMCVWVVGQT